MPSSKANRAGARNSKTKSSRAAPGKTTGAPPVRGARAEPRPAGRGNFYQVEVRPASQFKTFRTQEIGKPGDVERISGQRNHGNWETQKWLIGKRLAAVVKQRLIARSPAAKKIFQSLAAQPKHIAGNRFAARPRTP